MGRQEPWIGMTATTWHACRPPPSQIETFLPGRRLQTLETAAARKAREVAWGLQAEGYVEASVNAQVKGGEETASVALDVRRGPRAARVAVSFEGNEGISDQDLAAVLPRTNKPEFFSLLSDDRQRLSDLLRLRFAKEGFVRTRVLAPRTAWDAASSTLTVTIPIEQGPRAIVESIELPEEAADATGPGAPKRRLEPGQPFNIESYLADRNALLAWYRSEGYPDARIASVLEPREDNLRIMFRAEPGPRPRVGQVRLAREGRTRVKTVDDLVSLEPGDLIRPNELAASRDRLSESRAFRSVDLRTAAGGGAGETRDILVDLVPRPDVEIEYGVRYTTKSSNDSGGGGAPSDSQGGPFQFAGGLEMTNPFGRASRIRLQTVVNGSRMLNSVTYDTPTFLSKPLRTQLFVYDDDDFDTEIQGLAQRVQAVSLQQTKRWREPLPGQRRRDRLFLQYGYTFKIIHYTAIDSDEVLKGDRGFFSVSLIGDARDSLTDPHRGLFWTAGTDLAAKAFGSDVNYARLFGQVFAYVPLGSKVVWAQALRLGAVPGSDPLLLLDTRFMAGGATTVRGFEQNALGPQTIGGEPLGGQGLLVFNEELRFPIWQRLRGGLFYDAGNVWALAGDVSWRDLRHSVGGGLRFLFPFGPLRLDWARVLNPREGEQRSRFVFSLGYAF
jgi:outer membrane protein insertion porin family